MNVNHAGGGLNKRSALGESLGIWFILANGKCTSSPSNFLPSTVVVIEVRISTLTRTGQYARPMTNNSSEDMAHDLPLVDKAKHISASLVAYGSSHPRSCIVHLPIGAFVAVVAPLFENALGLYHTCQTFVGATYFAAFRLVYLSSNVVKLYRLLETD
ncbi:unnamed protein product [Prunus armeniaca]|uniref:Uncharacterized protein n=1 Tax=Prunus armeniaca TaxID=36596 RepID=A0A6J5VLH2_PRUAR|nr:unnamed protein product [Prunus armeniaca]